MSDSPRSDAPTAPPAAELFRFPAAFRTYLGAELPAYQLAYQTWGCLNPARDNALLIATGLSASSHAASHPADSSDGWWERMVGPGKPIDTDRWYVICANVLGGCYGSTGPSSTNPSTGRPYQCDFPLLTVWDFVATQLALLDALDVDRLDAVVGASLGGMQALALAAMAPNRTRRVVAISAPGRSYPLSISLRHAQREAVMKDPRWMGGRYSDDDPPRAGLHLARQIGTITYRSGPEWDRRFARDRQHAATELTTDFAIESYLRYQGDRFVARFDPNSYLYISKAMDLFDLADGAATYEQGVCRIEAETLVIGVTTDLLFPVHQQEELARILRSGGRPVRYVQLDSVYGHDSFLVDHDRFAPIMRGFLG